MQRYMGGMATQDQRELYSHVVRKARRQGAILTTHDIADVDGLGGCYAVQRDIGGRGTAIVAGNMIARTDPLIGKLGIKVKGWQDIKPDDGRKIIVVDTNTPSLLRSGNGRITDENIRAVIDHHRLTSKLLLKCGVSIINEKAVSVCEILASLIPQGRIENDRSMALALAVGIAGDSNKLLTTDRQTLHIFERLLEISGESRATIDALAYPRLSAQTVADLLGDMRHVRAEAYQGRLIAIGKTTQDVPALLAIALQGMDVTAAVSVGTIRKGQYRLSFRVTDIDADCGIFASDIARETSEKLGMPKSMYGGGHETMAGAVVSGSYKDVVAAALSAAKEVIDHALGRKH